MNETAVIEKALKFREEKDIALKDEPIFVYGKDKNIICETDKRGLKSPRGLSPLEIVVDASEGFIPLWAKNTTLRWRFQERSIRNFQYPEEAKKYIRSLFAKAVYEWEDAAPVRFAERDDLWDFEIVTLRNENCSGGGCVLASAFFPDSGRHSLNIYPTLFRQSPEEQVETLIHEIGHIFGLRHFFAKIRETQWASEVYGEHHPFSIMNYGEQSVLTDADKSDLRSLYSKAWAYQLDNINGTPIKFVKPFSASAGVPANAFVPAMA